MTIKKIVPGKIKKEFRNLKRLYILQKVRRNHKNALQKVRKKDKVRVAFFLINESIWKYEKLYFLLLSDKRFDPVVFICPFKTYGQEIMKQEMENTYHHFISKGYRAIKVMNSNGDLMDVKHQFRPDLVFFCTPWSHSCREYSIYNFFDTLTCFVNYGFVSRNTHQLNYNMDLHVYCWKYFIETPIHQGFVKDHSLSKGKNTAVTGYPGIDPLIDENYIGDNVWKPQSKKKKKIIWAPHHTIRGSKNSGEYSTFLDYAEYMIELSHLYKEKIQIAFKPHPNLKGKLYEIWGVKKTNRYYSTWYGMTNGQLEEGEYIDLFLGSDAMIHDSGSFILEYLATQKPMMYLMDANQNIDSKLNVIGKEAFDKMYLGYKKQDVLKFIENVILNKIDPKMDERRTFFENYLKPPNHKLASENIYSYLVKAIR